MTQKQRQKQFRTQGYRETGGEVAPPTRSGRLRWRPRTVSSFKAIRNKRTASELSSSNGDVRATDNYHDLTYTGKRTIRFIFSVLAAAVDHALDVGQQRPADAACTQHEWDNPKSFQAAIKRSDKEKW